MASLAEQFRQSQKRGSRALSFPKDPPRLNAAGVKAAAKGGPLKRASKAETVRDRYADAIKASAALGASLATLKQNSSASEYAGLLSSTGIKPDEAQTYINLAAASMNAKPVARRAAKSTDNELYGRV